VQQGALSDLVIGDLVIEKQAQSGTVVRQKKADPSASRRNDSSNLSGLTIKSSEWTARIRKKKMKERKKLKTRGVCKLRRLHLE
jgi:hypothetical protein